MAVSANGSFVYVSNYGGNTVSVIDTATNKVVGAAIRVGSTPGGMAVTGNRLFVANTGDDTVSVIDTSTNKVVGTAIRVGDGPTGVMVSPDGSIAYVANSAEGTVTVIDTATNTVIDTSPGLSGVQPLIVGDNPIQIAVHGTRLYVANTGDATVSLIDITANANAVPVASITPFSAPDPATGQVTATLTVSDPDGNPITVKSTTPSQGSVGVVDNADGTWTLTYTPTAAGRLKAALSTDAVTDGFAVTVSDIHAGPPIAVTAPVARGYFAGIETISAGQTADYNVISLTVSGNTGYITNAADGTLAAVDLTTNTPIWVRNVDSPIDTEIIGDHLYVDSYGDGTVSTVTMLDKNTGNRNRRPHSGRPPLAGDEGRRQLSLRRQPR